MSSSYVQIMANFGVLDLVTPDVSTGEESCFPFPAVAKGVRVCVEETSGEQLIGTFLGLKINWDISGVKPRSRWVY